MISVQSAKSMVFSKVPKPKTRLLSIEESYSYTLASTVISPIDLPNFDNSAMDGFGLAFSDLESGIFKFKLVEESKAGNATKIEVESKTACPIYTGAIIPKGVDTVIPLEKVKVLNGCIEVLQVHAVKGQHIRKQGEQIKKGDIALEKGSFLNPASIGFLAALGLREVAVCLKPNIAIITTGNELVEVDAELSAGQIFNSNGHSLKALLKESGVHQFTSFHVADNYEDCYRCFKYAIDHFDILISTGGVSVGKYDLVSKILSDLGVTKHFHKVNQKPGKPIYFGTKESKMIFGLPGNPAAVITSFYQYVLPGIKKWQNHKDFALVTKKAKLKEKYNRKSNRTQFLKAQLKNEEVLILEGQGSHILQTMAQANCIVELEADRGPIAKGDWVDIHLLPHA